MKIANLSSLHNCPMDISGFLRDAYVCGKVDVGEKDEGKAKCDE